MTISGRYTLITLDKRDDIAQIGDSRRGFKGLLSEYGWVYLINDTNAFLTYLYGKKQWDNFNLVRAVGLFNARLDYFKQSEIKYLKFIVPEKAVVYPEFLPKTLNGVGQSDARPAIQLQNALSDVVFYLAEYLIDAKSYGSLYFRGDTHPNWLGAYFIYQYAVNKIRSIIGASFPAPIPIKALTSSMCGYNGDVFSQIRPEDSARLNDQWQDLQFSDAFEYCIKYELAEKNRRAKPVALSKLILEMKFSREVIIKETDDPSLPTAVIFRDSTSDWMIDLLAEHFRRVVFIWHRGEVVRQILEDEKPDIVLHFMAERFVSAYAESMMPISEFSPDRV